MQYLRHEKIYLSNRPKPAALYMVPMFFVASRVVIAVFLLFDAADGHVGQFFVPAFIVAWLSDLIDGNLARALGVTSTIGAITDGLADLFLYFSILIATFCVYPNLAHVLSFFVVAGIIAQIIHECVGLIKFKKIVSYHSSFAKILSVILFFAVLEVFCFGRSCFIAILASVLWFCSNIEGIAMTVILPRYANNVPNIWAAIQASKNKQLNT